MSATTQEVAVSAGGLGAPGGTARPAVSNAAPPTARSCGSSGGVAGLGGREIAGDGGVGQGIAATAARGAGRGIAAGAAGPAIAGAGRASTPYATATVRRQPLTGRNSTPSIH